MSIEALAWAFKQKVGSSSAKLVLIHLSDRYNEHLGYGWPSIPHISEDTELNEKTVRSCIKKLEGLSLLSVDRIRVGSRNYSNKYRLHYVVPKLVPPQSDGVPKLVPGVVPKLGGELLSELLPSSKKKKGHTPDLPQEFLVWYQAQYETLLKQPLVVRWGRDKKLMKTILTAYPIEKAKVIARRLLDTTDKWLLGTGRDIPVLANQWQKLVLEGTYKPGIDGPSLPIANELLAIENRRRR